MARCKGGGVGNAMGAAVSAARNGLNKERQSKCTACRQKAARKLWGRRKEEFTKPGKGCMQGSGKHGTHSAVLNTAPSGLSIQLKQKDK